MHFASPMPWWLTAIVAAAVLGLAVASYWRTAALLTRAARATLIALRALAFGLVILFMARPVVMMPPPGARDIVVPVLVDVSRSMRIPDADGQTRIDRAVGVLTRDLLPALSSRFTPELYAVGDGLRPASPEHLAAEGRHSDLSAALAAVRERFRGRRVSGVVVLSDGGDTGQEDAAGGEASGIPVFTVGIGSDTDLRDREVVGVTAGDPRVDQASVDLHVSTVTYGYGRSQYELQLLANGRVVESRRIVPIADGSPSDTVFTVSPDPQNPTVFTARIDPAADELVPENNAQSVLISPAGRKRRVLAIEGAPAFEHSFIVRALAHDPGLDVDTVVRKGANENGQPTFFVQAGSGRANLLTTGFPASREAMFAYDALLIANVEGDFFPRAQLQLAADFVSVRGGGLLVLGGGSFAEHGLIGTPLEEVMPVELNDRRGAVSPAAVGVNGALVRDSVVLTTAGETHPIMRLGNTVEETRKRWSSMPALAATAALGGPRPGAAVLAVAAAPGGTVFPVVAVQRYGRGRSMIFGGEASWRWKMMLPSSDRAFEFFWRQATRWLAGPAPDPVAITVPDSSEPGDSIEVAVDARDAAFQAADDAMIDATMTLPGGESTPVAFRRDSAVNGRFQAALHPDRAGLYRLQVVARRGAGPLGTADRWFYVGGADREFASPRLNEAFLRRVSRASGGRYVRAAEAASLVSSLASVVPQNAAPERRDLWQQPWAFALLIAVLSAEWILRRRWGLR